MSLRRAAAAGFSLIEVVIALAVIALLIGLLAPEMFGLIQNDKEQATRQQAERIYKAIFGDPARGDFGFLGDMGRLPNASLTELIDGSALTAFHTCDGSPTCTDHEGRAGTGWRGPYLRGIFTADLLKDGWGQPFTHSNGQVVSNGADGTASTADDIKFPATAPPTTGTLFVSVLANRIPAPLGSAARVYSPVNGEQVSSAVQNHPSPPGNEADTFNGYAFTLTHGIHVLKVAHTDSGAGPCLTVRRAVHVAVTAGQHNYKEVRMLTDATARAHGTYNCTLADP